MGVNLDICNTSKNFRGVDLGKTRFGSTACEETYRVAIAGFDREDQLIAASLTKPFFSSRYVEVSCQCGSIWLNKNSFKQRFSRDARSLEKLREVFGNEIAQGIVPDRPELGPQLIRRNELADLIKQCSAKSFSNRKLDDIIQTASMENGESKAKKSNRSILGNRYLLMTYVEDGDRLVGKGGFGKVNFAIDLKNKVIRVVKVVEGVVYFRQKKRLQFEIEALTKLKDQPGVVKAEHIVDQGNRCYMIMEYCNGGDLHGLLMAIFQNKKSKLSFPQKLRIAQDIALGLANIHKAGIAHVDLKLENILLREGREACIADFGLARNREDTLPRNEGTKKFWSPEKADSVKQPRNSRPHIEHDKDDIWALGTIFLSLFDKEPAAWPKLNQFPQEDIDKEIDECMPEETRDLIKQILQKDPKKRPNINQIVELLAQI